MATGSRPRRTLRCGRADPVTAPDRGPYPPAGRARPVGDFDALLLLSFGGPEGPDDVLPFLRRVTAGRDVPDERLARVAAQYHSFGGRSPINDQCRVLLAALRDDLDRHDMPLPLYWGNRNWHPFLAETVAQMAADGVRRAVVFVTSPYSSHAGCRRYLDDLDTARAGVSGAPGLHKLRPYYDHPGFVEPMAENTIAALERLPAPMRAGARLVFTAHSIPTAMADASEYEAQLSEVSRLVSDLVAAGSPSRHGQSCPSWDVVYQSRSGPRREPWLEPDVNEHLVRLAAARVPAAVLVPIGFVSDHMEVAFDLDVRAAATATEHGLAVVRAATVSTHPRFVAMIRELVGELVSGAGRTGLGTLVPRPDQCQPGCCVPPGGR
jgi:protoporphyrin/coproporphyrin ferrochelatase